MSIILTEKPQTEAITLPFAKSHLNILGNVDDVLLTTYISVAREHAEGMLCRALISQTWDYSINSFQSEICIPKPPLQSVTSITYIDENGATQTLSPNIYDVDIGVTPGVIRLSYDSKWPSARNTPNAITIKFIAGYGDNESDIPFRIRQATALYVGHLYENREATAAITIKEVPMAFESLISNYRWSFF